VLRWILWIAVAALLVAAVGVRAADRLAEGQTARMVVAGACLVAAVAARRLGTRGETAGFCVAAMALLGTVAIDAIALVGLERVAREGGARAVEQRMLLAHAATGLVAFLIPAVVGMLWMRIPTFDLLRLPERNAVRAFAIAVVAALLLHPVLRAADELATNSIRSLFSKSAAAPAVWPGWKAVLARETSGGGSLAFATVALSLSIVLPMLEVLGHGVLRQAFHRWGAVPFVLATASLSSLLLLSGSVSYAVFGGSLVTGLLAARSGSIFPGVAFWLALWSSAALWMRLA
jgi:hypothetical protein